MVLVCNGKEFEINEGQTIKEVIEEEIKNASRDIIACIFNNEVKSLNHKPKLGGKVELLDYTTTEGKRVYVRGIMYIMAMAVNEIYPESHLTINWLDFTKKLISI